MYNIQSSRSYLLSTCILLDLNLSDIFGDGPKQQAAASRLNAEDNIRKFCNSDSDVAIWTLIQVCVFVYLYETCIDLLDHCYFVNSRT